MFSAEGLDAIQPGQEVDVPELAPEFSVRHPTQAGRLLPGNHILDGAILDRLQFGRSDFEALVAGARYSELRRAQQAADVIGTEWWNGPQHFRTIVA
jgi:hypothetical protein